VEFTETDDQAEEDNDEDNEQSEADWRGQQRQVYSKPNYIAIRRRRRRANTLQSPETRSCNCLDIQGSGAYYLRTIFLEGGAI
jgi:hypothetical protein